MAKFYFYFIAFTLALVLAAVKFVSSETPCTNSLKEEGTCLSTWDCIRQDGRRLGICAKGFLFGVCCGLNLGKIKSFESKAPTQPVISTLKHLHPPISMPPSSPSPPATLNIFQKASNVSQVVDTYGHFKLTTPATATSTGMKRGTTVKLITTRPTIDPFAEIVTTARPARTVKVLTRETFTSEQTTISPMASSEQINYNKLRTKVPSTLHSSASSSASTTSGQTGGSTAGGNNNLTTNDSVNLFSVTETNEITDNEIALDSLDDTTTTEANCCNGDNNGNSNSNNNGNTSDSSFSGDKRRKNNNKTATSVTFTNAHSHPMHNYSSTQMTIESTGETVDTDNSVLLSTMVAPQSNIIVVTPSTVVVDMKNNNNNNNGNNDNNDNDKVNPSVIITSTTSQSNDTTINLAVSALASPEKGSLEVISATTTAPTETGFITATATESTSTATAATTTTTTPVTSSPTTTAATATSSSSPTKVKSVTKNETKVSTDRPYVSHLDCGVRPLNPYGRVVGGRNAQFGEWPWQVLIKEATWLGLFVKTKCGGVLVDHKWVLTAAHCQPGFLGKLVVIVGEYDLTGDFEKLKPVVKQVKRMVVHRDYNPETFENDIALLELESKFEVQPHVIPICLPEVNSKEEYVGRIGHVAGWGKLSYGGPVPSILQVVKLPVIPNSQCQRMFLTAGHHKIIRNTFLCAGYNDGGKDSCEGDSGGPLMVQEENGRWTLIGTVSHGIKCAEPNLPGVYMRTSAYRPWIDSIIRSDMHTYKNYTVLVS